MIGYYANPRGQISRYDTRRELSPARRGDHTANRTREEARHANRAFKAIVIDDVNF